MRHRISQTDFPPTKDVQDAVVLLLYEHGGEFRALFARDTYLPIAGLLGLRERERSITRAEDLNDGRNEAYWHTQVQSAKERLLKKGKLWCPKRGIWMLTAKGERDAEEAKASIGTMALCVFAVYFYERVTAAHLKSPSELTLEDLGL